MIDTGVVLVGGKGLRLRPLTNERPKSMVFINGRPLVEWIILWLKKHGIKRIVLSVDYKKEVLMDHVRDGKALGVQVTYNDHSGCFETGDVFRHILEHQNLPEVFLALNGDQITALSVAEVFKDHTRHNPIATIVTYPTRIPYGILKLHDDGRVKAFEEKPILPGISMNTGIYIFNKSILPYLPTRGLIEKETFAKLAEQGKLRAYMHRGFFTTISDEKDIAEAERELKSTEARLL